MTVAFLRRVQIFLLTYLLTLTFYSLYNANFCHMWFTFTDRCYKMFFTTRNRSDKMQNLYDKVRHTYICNVCCQTCRMWPADGWQAVPLDKLDKYHPHWSLAVALCQLPDHCCSVCPLKMLAVYCELAAESAGWCCPAEAQWSHAPPGPAATILHHTVSD